MVTVGQVVGSGYGVVHMWPLPSPIGPERARRFGAAHQGYWGRGATPPRCHGIFCAPIPVRNPQHTTHNTTYLTVTPRSPGRYGAVLLRAVERAMAFREEPLLRVLFPCMTDIVTALLPSNAAHASPTSPHAQPCTALLIKLLTELE